MSIITKLVDRIEYEPVKLGMTALAECIEHFYGQRISHENLDLLTMMLFRRGFTQIHYSSNLEYVTASNVHISVKSSLQGITQ